MKRCTLQESTRQNDRSSRAVRCLTARDELAHFPATVKGEQPQAMFWVIVFQNIARPGRCPTRQDAKTPQLSRLLRPERTTSLEECCKGIEVACRFITAPACSTYSAEEGPPLARRPRHGSPLVITLAKIRVA